MFVTFGGFHKSNAGAQLDDTRHDAPLRRTVAFTLQHWIRRDTGECRPPEIP